MVKPAYGKHCPKDFSAKHMSFLSPHCVPTPHQGCPRAPKGSSSPRWVRTPLPLSPALICTHYMCLLSNIQSPSLRAPRQASLSTWKVLLVWTLEGHTCSLFQDGICDHHAGALTPSCLCFFRRAVDPEPGLGALMASVPSGPSLLLLS